MAVPGDAILELKFNNTLANTGSNGETLTLTAGTTAYTTGIKDEANGALSLDGATYFDSSGSTFPTADGSDFTISFWFQITDTANRQAFFDNSAGASANRGLFGAYLETTTICYSVGYKGIFGKNAWNIQDDNAISVNTWYHYLLTWDGTTNTDGVKIYINNDSTPTTFTASSTDLFPPTENLRIGAFASVGTKILTGKLALFRVYDRVLSASERTELYNEDPTVSTLYVPKIFMIN